MTRTKYALAIAGLLAAAGFGLGGAAAAETALAGCNKTWGDKLAAKSTGGATYEEFLKGCLRAGAEAKPADAKPVDASAAAAKPAGSAKPDGEKPVVAAKTTDVAKAARRSCNKDWAALIKAGTQGTRKKPDFVKECLAKAGISPVLLAATSKPGEAAAPADAAKASRPPSAAQAALDTRRKDCAAQWKQAKADGKTNGMKWPQFWSQCNSKLKTASG